VLRLADARSLELIETMEADGRWRLFLFADRGDPAAPASRVKDLCDFLSASPQSPLRRHTPAGGDIDSVIDVRAVFQQQHRELKLETMPDLLVPAKGRLGLRDYEKLFCAAPRPKPDIFDLREIDRAAGALIVVRPDQYVAHVLPLDAYNELATFFAGILNQATSVEA
jgi:phenol 2-monooxygenase